MNADQMNDMNRLLDSMNDVWSDTSPSMSLDGVKQLSQEIIDKMKRDDGEIDPDYGLFLLTKLKKEADLVISE
ncbi:hypothetical protein ZOSMA_174G00200, partial [Zostera marina]